MNTTPATPTSRDEPIAQYTLRKIADYERYTQQAKEGEEIKMSTKHQLMIRAALLVQSMEDTEKLAAEIAELKNANYTKMYWPTSAKKLQEQEEIGEQLKFKRKSYELANNTLKLHKNQLTKLILTELETIPDITTTASMK